MTEEERIRRIFTKVKYDENTGCFLYLDVDSDQYKIIKLDKKYQHLHRFVYEFSKGPLLKEQAIHHTCKRKNCINPEHMYVCSWSEHATLHHKDQATDKKPNRLKRKIQEIDSKFIGPQGYIESVLIRIWPWGEVPRLSTLRRFSRPPADR